MRTAHASVADSVSVIAHRGACSDAPENTLPAIDLAARRGADFVEVDVQLTRDGRLVVVHDTHLRRTTDARHRFPGRGPWRVGDMTLAELRSLDAGSWFGSRYADTPVPTLQEVADTLHGRSGLLLEVKCPRRYPGIADALVDELRRPGALRAGARERSLVVQSFDWEFMRALQPRVPGVTIGLLGPVPCAHRLAEVSTWAHQLNPSHELLSAEHVARVHEHGMATWPFTVNSARRMRGLLRAGVDGIITNRTDRLDMVLRARRPLRVAA